MKPFIINAHLGENEDQVILFVSFTKFYIMPKRVNNNVILFSDELEKRGHEVHGFVTSTVFSGHQPETDGGYAFTITMANNTEEHLMRDVYEILENLGSL